MKTLRTIVTLIEQFAMSYVMVAVIDQAFYDWTPWYGLKSQAATWGIAAIVFIGKMAIEKLNIEKKEVELI